VSDGEPGPRYWTTIPPEHARGEVQNGNHRRDRHDQVLGSSAVALEMHPTKFPLRIPIQLVSFASIDHCWFAKLLRLCRYIYTHVTSVSYMLGFDKVLGILTARGIHKNWNPTRRRYLEYETVFLECFAQNERHWSYPPWRRVSATYSQGCSVNRPIDFTAPQPSASAAGYLSRGLIMARLTTPLVTFYRLIPEARLPQRADRSAAGTLPTRAYRYCHPVTTATGFGWWIFPPTNLQFLWNGYGILWKCTDWPRWLPLERSAQFPDFAERFDKAAPAPLAGCSPPFLSALPEPGGLQIWTGLMARTAANWSLLIRSPANMTPPDGYTMYEGIVETDRWFGPVFTNLRLTRTHWPVQIHADFPLLQAQPLPRESYADVTLGSVQSIVDMGGLTDTDWSDYRDTIVVPNEDHDRGFGRYAVEARRLARRGCPGERGLASSRAVCPTASPSP
jgi:Family of unknown function (DUF6065)